MWPFYAVAAPIALIAMFAPARRLFPLLWGIAFLVLLVFVGLRHHVGMDWNNYIGMIARANQGDLWDAFDIAEPGYALLLYVSGQLDFGIYGTYFAGTLIFLAGLFRYAQTTPSPWVALLVAIPFLVIVVGMSAARQTVAIGILLWLAAEWSKASVTKRTALILLASMFHFSAAGFLLFVFLDLRVRLWLKVAGSAVMMGAIFYIMETTGRAEYYNDVYISGQSEMTQSEGALMHVMLNGGPALLAFALGKRYRSLLIPDRLHMQMTLAAIALIPLALVTSTAAGRITLYLFPVSMWIFAALPQMFHNGVARLGVRTFIAFFFPAILVIWLNFGNASIAHRNYNNALLVEPHLLELCCR